MNIQSTNICFPGFFHISLLLNMEMMIWTHMLKGLKLLSSEVPWKDSPFLASSLLSFHLVVSTRIFFWSSSSTTSSSSSTRQWQSYIREKILNWDSWCGMWQHNVEKVWSLEHLNFSGHLEWSAETMPFSLKYSSFRFWFSLKPLHCWLYDHIWSICIIRPSKFQIPPKKC